MAQTAAANQVAALAANNARTRRWSCSSRRPAKFWRWSAASITTTKRSTGSVNVTIALRQPGSTMKPFTYSAAMELGMTPGDIIWDTPTDIGGYQPRNYDRTFHGPVRMRTALANSYNIPAVQTLRRIGVPTLLAICPALRRRELGHGSSQYGFADARRRRHHAAGTDARLYAIFANGGSCSCRRRRYCACSTATTTSSTNTKIAVRAATRPATRSTAKRLRHAGGRSAHRLPDQRHAGGQRRPLAGDGVEQPAATPTASHLGQDRHDQRLQG